MTSRLTTLINIVAALHISAATIAAAETGPASARGVIRALNQTTISTDLSVPVLTTPVREGQSFRRGDIVLELDCRRPWAEHDGAAAFAREMKFTHDSQAVIVRHGAGSRHDMDVARARLDKANAEHRVHIARLEQCRVIAPYDGIVVELLVRAHETTVPGKPAIALLDTQALEVEIIIDTSLMRELAVGRTFRFDVDELGRSIRVRLDRMGGSADPISRTIKVIGVPLELVPGLVPGMSGTAQLGR
jgi:membrane fusion protein, multidrug efflux system